MSMIDPRYANWKAFARDVEKARMKALEDLAYEVLRDAKMIAPLSMTKARYKKAGKTPPKSGITTGSLRRSGTVELVGKKFRVAFGTTPQTEPYARYQEFGGDGTRVVQNYSTPNTGAHYLEKASKRVGAVSIPRLKRWLQA